VSFSAGDTFCDPSHHIDTHLHMIISDPAVDPENVVLVNFTTNAISGDASCPVRGHEHPWLRHDSYVSFAHARVRPLAWLEEMERCGHIVRDAPLSTELLERIRRASSASTAMPTGAYDVLDQQGLIDP